MSKKITKEDILQKQQLKIQEKLGRSLSQSERENSESDVLSLVETLISEILVLSEEVESLHKKIDGLKNVRL